MRRRPRPRLIDRMILWVSASKRVDGLWIGVLADEPEPLFGRVEKALHIIKTFDRLRYDRLIRDLEGVWITLLFGSPGAFSVSLNICMLDRRFVADNTISVEAIASMIVHEATHARLRRRGIGYEEELRARVEAVCIRQQLAFTAKLPNGKKERESAEGALDWYAVPEVLTDRARRQRYAEDLAEYVEQREAEHVKHTKFMEEFDNRDWFDQTLMAFERNLIWLEARVMRWHLSRLCRKHDITVAQKTRTVSGSIRSYLRGWNRTGARLPMRRNARSCSGTDGFISWQIAASQAYSVKLKIVVSAPVHGENAISETAEIR